MNNQVNNNQYKRYIECKNCKRQILWIRSKKYNRCTNEIIDGFWDGRNQNEGNDQLNVLRQEIGSINTIPLNSINQQNRELMY